MLKTTGMDHFTYSKRLSYILELIEKRRLSSPKDLTDKFGCSERTVRKMINDLRRDGHSIRYSRKNFKYFLE
ncbi:HTH domain-containing protein [Fulvivirga ligni]|uniref:HTH domain-containing protein n=1 Tax=Fulvivirga ligni TaxID=2904246 RepID=UPI001F225F47|nr:HTH domain-containing protein [Fulvivirga ligni]UII23442.1 HTH domain-containing protein [Fulvivirga ligni]